MKITTEQKAILWSIIEKYDGIYTNLCDSLSRIIQGKSNNTDLINVYGNLLGLELIDKKNIDLAIGSEIDACMFSF